MNKTGISSSVRPDQTRNMIAKNTCEDEKQKQKPCREEAKVKARLEIDIEVDMKPETKTTARAGRGGETEHGVVKAR